MLRASSWAARVLACALLVLTVSAPALAKGARTLTATRTATKRARLATVAVRPRTAVDLRTMAGQPSNHPPRAQAPGAWVASRHGEQGLSRRARLHGRGA